MLDKNDDDDDDDAFAHPNNFCQLPPADPLKIQLPQKQRLLVRPANQHRFCHKLPIPFKDFKGFLWKWYGSSMGMGVQFFPIDFWILVPVASQESLYTIVIKVSCISAK